jgi:hypothetical protein
MDTMLPTLERQSAPAIRRLVQQLADTRALVENIRREHPGATADWIVALLADAGVEASGSWVAHWLRQPLTQTRATWPRIAQATNLSDHQKLGGNGKRWTSDADHITPASNPQPKTDGSLLPTLAYSTKERRDDLLKRFIERLYYSVARYLQDARPWIRPGDEPLWELIQQIASDQEAFALRAARLLGSRRQRVRNSQYPSEYGRYNDLAVRYVAGELILEQPKLLDELEHLLSELPDDQEAWRIVHAASASQRRLSHELEAALQAHSVPERYEGRITRAPERPRTDEGVEKSPLSHTGAPPVTAA